MSRTSPPPQWSGEMLNRPDMMQAFTGQLRQVLNGDAVFVDRIRRDAEAMWAANPPAECNGIVARWRNWRTRRPFRRMQRYLEKSSKLTFQLEARYRRNFHEIPEERRRAVEAKQQQALPAAEPAQSQQQPQKRLTRADQNFLEMLQQGKSA